MSGTPLPTAKVDDALRKLLENTAKAEPSQDPPGRSRPQIPGSYANGKPMFGLENVCCPPCARKGNREEGFQRYDKAVQRKEIEPAAGQVQKPSQLLQKLQTNITLNTLEQMLESPGAAALRKQPRRPNEKANGICQFVFFDKFAHVTLNQTTNKATISKRTDKATIQWRLIN